jgi:hypothetical protein
LQADDILQIRKDTWLAGCLELDLAQLIDVGVLTINNLSGLTDELKSRLSSIKSADIAIADLAGILPEKRPGVLPPDRDNAKRQLRILLRNWEVDLPTDLLEKVIDQEISEDSSKAPPAQAVPMEQQKKPGKKTRDQNAKNEEVIILGAILAYHKFESEEENLTPARQTELGELAGGWAQYKVSRAMESLLGPNPAEKYKMILRKPNPLEGFIKKGESPDDPNDVEALHYRPQHPTEADERRSENT